MGTSTDVMVCAFVITSPTCLSSWESPLTSRLNYKLSSMTPARLLFCTSATHCITQHDISEPTIHVLMHPPTLCTYEDHVMRRELMSSHCTSRFRTTCQTYHVTYIACEYAVSVLSLMVTCAQQVFEECLLLTYLLDNKAFITYHEANGTIYSLVKGALCPLFGFEDCIFYVYWVNE